MVDLKVVVDGLFFALIMVERINNEYYLNRSESIEYLTRAYDLKWCMTRWANGAIRITFEKTNGSRGNAKFEAYKCPKSKIVRLRKFELDSYFLNI